MVVGNEELLIKAVNDLMINGSATRRFELVTRGFELVTHGFELVTRGFEIQLVLLSFQLVTRNS